MGMYYKIIIASLELVRFILEWHCKKCKNKAEKTVERFRESEGK